MTSNIDVTVPSSPIALTRDVRRNFEVIKKEIEALQAFMANLGTFDSPNFTGTIHGASETLTGNLTVGGDVTILGNLTPISIQTPVVVLTATITGWVAATYPLTFRLMPGGFVFFDCIALVTFNAGALGADTFVPIGGLRPEFRPLQSINLPVLQGSLTSSWFITIGVDGKLTISSSAGPVTGLNNLSLHGVYKI